MTQTKKVYDLLAREYHSNAHQTVKCFQGVQRLAIIRSCIKAASRLNKKLEDIHVLNIGCGESEQRRDLCIWSLGLFKQRVKDSHMTDLDISEEMLKAASIYYPKDLHYLKKIEDGKIPKQIQGDASTVQLPEESYDVVITALADHIPDQPALYRNVFGALRPQGSFIVTYPHKTLMTVIRRDIYGIDVEHTRFIIDGSEYLIPSLSMDSYDVRHLYKSAGFKIETSKTLYVQDGLHPDTLVNHAEHPFSQTIWKAKKLLRRSARRLPILAFGVGTKP